ncbi:MAG: hypothetical protein L0Y57_06390, partial [Beijerinckiaceae bacterium]|nr:hypothetical protein [Beijerinckiaceae bacterium]
MQASTLRNIMMFASVTVLPLACAGFAEARGVGVTGPAAAKKIVYAGRGAASLSYSRALPLQPRHEIIAEQKPIQVSVTEASTLVEQLRSQLAAQPNAT